MIYVYLSIVVDKSPGSYFHLGIPWLVDSHSLGRIWYKGPILTLLIGIPIIKIWQSRGNAYICTKEGLYIETEPWGPSQYKDVVLLV